MSKELHKNSIIEELAGDTCFEVEVVVSRVFIVKVKNCEDAEDIVRTYMDDAMERSELEVTSTNDGIDNIKILGECSNDTQEDIEVTEEYYDW